MSTAADVVSRYPTPIALPYLRLLEARGPAERAAALRAVTLETTRFLALVATSDLLHDLARDPLVTGLPDHPAFALLRRADGTPGPRQWLALLGEASEELGPRGDRSLATLPRACRPGGAVHTALDELCDPDAPWRSEPPRGLRDAVALLDAALGELDFLGDTPLAVVARGRAGRYRAYSCVGAHVQTAEQAHRFRCTAALLTDVPLLVDADGERALSLWPLVRQRPVDESARPRLYPLASLLPGEAGANLVHVTGVALDDPSDAWDEVLNPAPASDLTWLFFQLRQHQQLCRLPTREQLAKHLLEVEPIEPPEPPADDDGDEEIVIEEPDAPIAAPAAPETPPLEAPEGFEWVALPTGGGAWVEPLLAEAPVWTARGARRLAADDYPLPDDPAPTSLQDWLAQHGAPPTRTGAKRLLARYGRRLPSRAELEAACRQLHLDSATPAWVRDAPTPQPLPGHRLPAPSPGAHARRALLPTRPRG